MKIKLDENLPDILADSLQNLGHEVHTVLGEGLKGRNDQVIWDAAQAESRFLITKTWIFLVFSDSLPGLMPGSLLFAYMPRAGRI